MIGDDADIILTFSHKIRDFDDDFIIFPTHHEAIAVTNFDLGFYRAKVITIKGDGVSGIVLRKNLIRKY